MKKFLVVAVACWVLIPALLVTSQEVLTLPKPQSRNTVGFEEVLNKVQTDRTYNSRPLSLSDFSYVLWSAAGNRFNTDAVSSASKTYPSGLGIYPVRMHVLVGNVEGVKSGIYLYLPPEHGLKLLKAGDNRKKAVEGSTYASFVALAPATVVLAADYGSVSGLGERGRSVFLPFEVGQVAQMLRLGAAASGLAVGISGGFNPTLIKDLFGIAEEPFVLLPFGYPP
jgi:SagB-type dehydrogenase family enzyme